MANNNVLEGMRCPECGQDDAFLINVTGQAYVRDSGVVELTGDTEWDDDSRIKCYSPCGYSRLVKHFRTENQEDD